MKTLATVLTAALVLASSIVPANADVLCRKSNGAVMARETCKAREEPLHISVVGDDVGIGTKTPDGCLHIKRGWNGRSGSQLHVDASGDPTNGYASINLRRYSTGFSSGLHFYASNEDYADGFIRMENNSRDLMIALGGGTAHPVERLRITNAGNIGIGTAAPQTDLHVAGVVRATTYETGDIIFQKDGSKHWRMFEEGGSLRLENFVSKKRYRLVIREIK